jgi:hypothetical protein
MTSAHAMPSLFDAATRYLEQPPTVSGLVPRLGATLLTLLECPYMQISNDTPYSVAPAEFCSEHEDEIRRILPTLLTGVLTHRQCDVSTGNIASLLWGVDKHKLLDAFTVSEDTSYDLAIAILRFTGFRSNHPLDEFVAPNVLSLLNTWAKPSVAWLTAPKHDVIARALFGTAWWDLAERPSWLNGGFTANIVERERPPFLPGLCPAQDALSVPLPESGFTL